MILHWLVMVWNKLEEHLKNLKICHVHFDECVRRNFKNLSRGSIPLTRRDSIFFFPPKLLCKLSRAHVCSQIFFTFFEFTLGVFLTRLWSEHKLVKSKKPRTYFDRKSIKISGENTPNVFRGKNPQFLYVSRSKGALNPERNVHYKSLTKAGKP